MKTIVRCVLLSCPDFVQATGTFFRREICLEDWKESIFLECPTSGHADCHVAVSQVDLGRRALLIYHTRSRRFV